MNNWTLQDDYRVWACDGTEEVIYHSERGSYDPKDRLTEVLRMPITKREKSPTGGAYLGYETSWIIPKQKVKFLYSDGREPKPGDKIEELNGNRHVVITAQNFALQNTWQLETVNLILAEDLREDVRLFAPTESQDAGGSRLATFSAVTNTVKGKIQETQGSLQDQRGKRGTVREYQIFLENFIESLNTDWIAKDADDNIYDIVSYSNPQMLLDLFTLNVQRRP